MAPLRGSQLIALFDKEKWKFLFFSRFFLRHKSLEGKWVNCMISGSIYSSEMRKRDETIFARNEKKYSIKKKYFQHYC